MDCSGNRAGLAPSARHALGRTKGGYGAITGPDGAIHASCSPDDPTKRPDCYRRITEFGERPGALVGVEPEPVGVEDIRG